MFKFHQLNILQNYIARQKGPRRRQPFLAFNILLNADPKPSQLSET